MSQPALPEYRVMLSVDVEDYSSRTDAEQRQLQDALANAIDRAATAAGLNRGRWLTQFGGDGVFAVLPERTDVTRLMDGFLRELDAELGAYNRRRREQSWTRVRLRLAVHAGPVYLDGPTGWPGQHAVVPARLRDSEPIRTALEACPGADLAVIVSSEIYRDYVSQGPGNPRPTEFRAVLAQAKKQSYIAYLFVPGFDVHDVAALAEFDTSGTPPRGLNVTDAKDQDAKTRPASPSHASQPRPEVKRGRDVIFGDRVSGRGTIYRIGGDLWQSTDPRGGKDDER
jgi:class 3 adenylate cyclase